MFGYPSREIVCILGRVIYTSVRTKILFFHTFIIFAGNVAVMHSEKKNKLYNCVLFLHLLISPTIICDQPSFNLDRIFLDYNYRCCLHPGIWSYSNPFPSFSVSRSNQLHFRKCFRAGNYNESLAIYSSGYVRALILTVQTDSI